MVKWYQAPPIGCPVALIVKGENRVCAVVVYVARYGYNRDEIDSPGKLTAASWMVKKATFLFNIYPSTLTLDYVITQKKMELGGN